jgi:UDP-N-acetylglucosamine 4,6-dehydratase
LSSILSGRTVLVTGGTGSFGQAFTRYALAMANGPRSVRILSRDELKQAEMRQRFHDDHRLRFLLGDIRDIDRLRLAFRGVDLVIHAAALKRVDACDYSPFEAVRTNILGTQNVIQAALDNQVSRTLFLSSDKACAPLNLYGKSKAVAEDLCRAAHSYAGDAPVKFASLRYGNVAGSRGSVVPAWREALEEGRPLVVNDAEATRYWFTLQGAVDFAIWALTVMQGGELFVPKLPSFYVRDLAHAMGSAPQVGEPRPGDKRDEAMVAPDEAPYFREWEGRYVRFLPGRERGDVLPAGFSYTSANNERWLGVSDLREALRAV